MGGLSLWRLKYCVVKVIVELDHRWVWSSLHCYLYLILIANCCSGTTHLAGCMRFGVYGVRYSYSMNLITYVTGTAQVVIVPGTS